MERKIDFNRKVSVYYNLHRKCYSIQQGGLVVAHASRVWLSDVTPRIRKAGQDKVRATGRKNVHAFLTGCLVAHTSHRDGEPPKPRTADYSQCAELYYNPYKVDTFVEKTSGKPVAKAADVWLEPRAIYARTITYGG